MTAVEVITNYIAAMSRGDVKRVSGILADDVIRIFEGDHYSMDEFTAAMTSGRS